MYKSILVLALVLAGSTATAQIYKWVDSNGVPHYSTTPPPESAKAIGVIEDDDELPSTNISFLDKLYTRESFKTEKESLREKIRYYNGKCMTDPKMTPEYREAQCIKFAQKYQRTLDVLTTNPDRYFYVMDRKKNLKGGLSGNTPLYLPWD